MTRLSYIVGKKELPTLEAAKKESKKMGIAITTKYTNIGYITTMNKKEVVR